VHVIGEGGRGQCAHELAIHRRDVEVEARHVAMHRELRGMHLVLTERIARSVPRPAASARSTIARESSPAFVPLLHQIGPRAGHPVQAQCLGFPPSRHVMIDLPQWWRRRRLSARKLS
jgi:hypothetical protein